ncbi:MAG: DUF1648 domain-containing protein [Bacteroidota bacterium]
MKTSQLSLYMLFAIGMLAMLQAAWFYPQLPETVASHFNASGVADGYMSKIGFLVFQVIFIPAMGLLFVGIGRLLNQIPASLINVPNREYHLSEERKAFTFSVLTNQLRWFGVVTMLLLLIVCALANKANLSQPPVLPMPTYLLMSYFIFTLIWTAMLVLKFRKKH